LSTRVVASATRLRAALTTIKTAPPPSAYRGIRSPPKAHVELLPLLKLAVARQASDLFLIVGAAPHLRIEGAMRPISRCSWTSR